MTSFSSRAESGRGEWWEIQHSYPDADGVVYRGWSSTDLGQFGDVAVELLRAAIKDDLFDGFVGDRRFRTESDACRYLIEFARVAVCHRSMSFRAARVVASISVEPTLEVTPPKICGKFGNYGPRDFGSSGDRYCQKAPGHGGGHGPRKKTRVAA